MNPNPHPLLVWQGMRLVEVLKKQQEITVVVTSELELSSEGKRSLVVFQAEGGDWNGEEWVQEITRRRAKPHPDEAIKQPDRPAHA